VAKKKQPAKKASGPPRFAVGTKVRVKPGVIDPDFPDVPLGGWAGTVKEVDRRTDPPLYLVAWNRYTLDHIHPVFRKRCERDGLDYESMNLYEADLEPDPGGPAVIEQPKEIRTRPLDPADEDDRVRMALGLTGDDPLSDVDLETLGRYHAHLSRHLTFPFPATYSQETGHVFTRSVPVTVVRLLDAEDIDDMYGLLCEARDRRGHMEVPLGEIEVKKGNPNRQLIADYSYWFWNYR
jgi:hypothetical protein